MLTEHKLFVTFAKVERHRVKSAFPGHPENREHDDMIVKIQRNSRYPMILSVNFCGAEITHMCELLSPSSLHPSCEVIRRKVSTLVNSLWVRFKTFADLK